MSKVIRAFLASAAIVFAGTTVSNAATFGFEAASGGEMASEAVSVIGDANGFTAFGQEWSMSVTDSLASGDASRQEFVLFPVPAVTTTLSLSMVEQMFDSGQYTGLFKVITDVSGLWGEYAFVKVTAPSLVGFGQGTLLVTEAVEVNPIPLPAGAWLILSGLCGLAALRRTAKV